MGWEDWVFGWEDCHQNDLQCVEWDAQAKLYCDYLYLVFCCCQQVSDMVSHLLSCLHLDLMR